MARHISNTIVLGARPDSARPAPLAGSKARFWGSVVLEGALWQRTAARKRLGTTSDAGGRRFSPTDNKENVGQMLSGKPVRRQLWHGAGLVGTALVEDDAVGKGGGGGNVGARREGEEEKGGRGLSPRWASQGMSHGAAQFQDSSAAQMMQKLASKPTPRHQPAPLTDRIHVSCLNVGGELFVGDAGLFGVLCSCHQLRMSVAKFCEHAGGPAEKAGEIVLMENGMSIAHWFKYCVGVGSYVTDTKCDRPEWACIDPSPEGYRLKNLLARNTSMEKVGLFNAYGKSTGPINGTVYSNDLRKSTGPISGTVYSSDLHNEGRGHTTVEKLGNKRDGTYYRSADVHTSFARNFALLQNSETNLGLAKNHTVNAVNLNQISRPSGSPYITASTNAHHNGNHSSHSYADLVENNFGASFRNPAPRSPVVFSNDTRAGRYNFPNKILQDSLSSASNTELKLGQSSYHQSLTALFPSAQSTLIDFQRPQSHLPSVTQNHCPRQTVKVSKNIGEHYEPPIGRGTSEQSNGVASAINRSEGGKVTDAAAKNSFISIFLSHLERNSEAIDDILKSSEHSLPKGLDGAYSSYHSKFASRQVEPRANDNRSKLASTSIHTERISDDRALSVALSGSSKVVPLANSQNSLIHSDCRSHLLPRQPNAGSSKVCDGAYSSYHSKSANRQVEPRANDNHSNLVSTSIHTKRISDGIALSVAPSRCASKVGPLANSHEPLIHSDCQSHLLHSQPNAGSSKICAGVPCPANCRTGNHAGDISHQAPCMYDKVGCMSFAPAPLSYQGHRYVLEIISCSLLAISMGHATNSLTKCPLLDPPNKKESGCGFAKHCDDRIDQSGSSLHKCKHDVQLPTRCVGESEKLRCPCSSSAQTPLLKAVSNKMTNQLFAPISERLKNVSEESVAKASSPYIAVTEKNGSCRGSGVCKERLKPGFSSGSSSAVVTKFPASPEFNNTSSCVDKYGVEHKKLMFDEGSRTEKSSSSSSYVPISTGCEKSLNGSSTFHLDTSKVKRKYCQISDGSTLKDNGKRQRSETQRKSRRLKCSEEHSESDDCTRKITLQSSENGDPQPQNKASSYSCSVSKIKQKHTTMQRNKPVKRPRIHQEILKGGEQSDGEGIMVGELNSSDEKKQVEDMSTLVRKKHQQEGSRMSARKPPKYVSLNCILNEPKSENVCSEVPLLDSSLIATGITDDNRKFPKIAPLSLVLKKAKRCNAVKTPCNTENIHSCEEKSAVRPVGKYSFGNQNYSSKAEDGIQSSKKSRYPPNALRLRPNIERDCKRPCIDLWEGKPIGPTDAETSQLSVQTSRKGFRNRRSSVSVDRIKKCEESANRSARGPCGDKQNVVQACEVNAGRYKERLSSADSCCVCRIPYLEPCNQLMECSKCFVKAHQACYGVLKVPRGQWFCRPCKTNANAQDTLGPPGKLSPQVKANGSVDPARPMPMPRTLISMLYVICTSIVVVVYIPKCCEFSYMQITGLRFMWLWRWSHDKGIERSKNPDKFAKRSTSLENVSRVDKQRPVDNAHEENTVSSSWTANHNSSLLVPHTSWWVHVVCGLWTPGTKCPNPTTMSAFDLSGALPAKSDYACSMCDRAGGSFMMCRDVNCSVTFHAWCAHQRGLLQSDPEGEHNEYIGFYGRCLNHATNRVNPEKCLRSNEWTCARTEGFKGRKGEGCSGSNYKKPQVKSSECSVSQEQINAWLRINGSKPCIRRQSKGWKHLVVYKSGIHGLGLYTSEFIPRGSMICIEISQVIEYVGEIVGQRVADKREIEYHSGKRQQYKSVCYFFKIDKEHIIDATRKGGIARFINHSCMVPNCVAKIISVKNEKKVVFFSERHIDPGEEITYDYHFNQEDEGERIPCFCRSFSCRQYLN
uniref:Histone-lysine N-methyltransferase n=1 Tax=Aegilops tauschii TaxID=37682 RepID=M8BXS4_AEGTA